MTEPLRLAVTQLKDLLPLVMWKLVHAGLVAETGVSIDIVLNRKDEKGRYIQLRVLPESNRRNPFCSHLRKWREVEALCFGCQRRSLDGFRHKYEHLGGGDRLPYMVETCHAGLFRIVFPLRVHDSLVAFVVVHALRQAGNEGVVMYRLRTFPERAKLGGRRKAISLQTAMPHLADVRGFSPRAWFKLVEDLRGNVRRIEERLTESYRRRCAEAEERLLFELTEMLPPAHEVTRKRLGHCMDKIAERIARFCNLTSFAYLRRAREGEQLEVVGKYNWPGDMDLEVFADCPPLPIIAGSETRPLQPGPKGPDRAPLEECSTSGKMLAIAEQVSCIYVCPRAMGQAEGTGLVSDMLFFGEVDSASEGLVEGLESKRSAFEKITRHLSSKLDALYRILHQQQLFSEMGHEISAPMNGMLLELSYIRGLHGCVYGRDLPTEVQCAFDLLTYYVKHVDHKRRNWLYACGPEGKPNLYPKPHPIGEILHEAVNVYRPLANRVGIVFVQEFYFTDLPVLCVDKELVHSVFANLLDNAIKYTVGQGAALFHPDDLLDAKGLLKELGTSDDRVIKHLRQGFLAETRTMLREHDPQGPASEDLVEAMVGELNRVITGPSLWGMGLFTTLNLRDETRRLKRRREEEDEDVIGLNRMLLEDAYPGCIRRGHLRERYIKLVADTSDPQWFRLSVSNFGFGIKEEWKELVFREGWRIPWKDIPGHLRADPSDKQLYRSGTGIGCAVIKRVMEDHGGKVTVESHKGHGAQQEPVGFRFWTGCKTTFTVEFPRQ